MPVLRSLSARRAPKASLFGPAVGSADGYTVGREEGSTDTAGVGAPEDNREGRALGSVLNDIVGPCVGRYGGTDGWHRAPGPQIHSGRMTLSAKTSACSPAARRERYLRALRSAPTVVVEDGYDAGLRRRARRTSASVGISLGATDRIELGDEDGAAVSALGRTVPGRASWTADGAREGDTLWRHRVVCCCGVLGRDSNFRAVGRVEIPR